jgi:hypothetical protein
MHQEKECRIIEYFEQRKIEWKRTFKKDEQRSWIARKVLCILNYEARSAIQETHWLDHEPDFCMLYNVHILPSRKQQQFNVHKNWYYTLFRLNEEWNIQSIPLPNWKSRRKPSEMELTNAKCYSDNEDFDRYIGILYPSREE